MKRGDRMKIDKEKLRAISEKSDAELWQTISGIAKSHGYNLPEKAPGKDEMQKIRSIKAIRHTDNK